MGKAEWTAVISILIAMVLITSFRSHLYYKNSVLTTNNTINNLDYLMDKNVINTLGKSSNFSESKDGYNYKLYYDYQGEDDSITDDFIYFTEELSLNQSFLKIEKLYNINLDEKKELIENLVIKNGTMYLKKGELYISRDNIYSKESNIKDFYNHNFIIKDGLNYLSFSIIQYSNCKQNDNTDVSKVTPNKGDGYRLWELQFFRDRSDIVINNIKDETVEITYRDGSTNILDKVHNKIFSDRQPFRLRVNHHVSRGYKYKVRQIAFLYRRKIIDRFVNKVYPLDVKEQMDLSKAPKGIIESNGR